MKKYLFIIGIFSLTSLLFSADKPKSSDTKKEKMVTSTFNGIPFRHIGTAHTSGRIIDIAISPKEKSTWYIAVAAGGVWKTTNAGTSFSPIFENEKSFSVGCVTIDPNNSNVIWVGSGENNSQRSVDWGDGIYKSLDGGKSWSNMGLSKSEHIGKIIVDPRNSQTIYVAAQGPLWAPGGDRGFYKSIDGGKTWKKTLDISENTGVSDLAIDSKDPNTIYCTSYQRRRHVWTMVHGGPEGAIYKSTDAGETWRKINNGLPGGDIGRIGIAISPQNSDVVYALVEAAEDGGEFFRSSDRGESWSKQNNIKTSSAQYYQEVICDPIQFDKIYLTETYTKVSVDGGKTFKNISNKERHVDDHALWIDPDNSKHIIIGGDGGLYESFDEGNMWRFFENLSVTQFYRIQADNATPFYNVYGGTQDNNTVGGPSQTLHEYGILNQDWFFVVGGDGYEPQIDPKNPDIVYGQWQYGNIVRMDKKSGEIVNIQPKEEKGEELRWNWDTPFIISQHSNSRLYIAANKVFRSDDYGDTWVKVSDDITRQIDRNTLPIMGKIWGPEAVAKSQSTSLFGNSIALAESPKQENLLYVGTDDGLIQVTEDQKNWRKIDKFPGIPDMTYVSDIYPSRHDANVVYASFNNHKNADFKPYLLKSNDKGKTWTSISSNLPDNGPIWTIEEDTQNPNLLFVGTEFGVFFTNDGGSKWIQLKGSFPTISVRDLDIQERENDLVVGTFGRGIYIVDNYSSLRDVNEDIFSKEAHIFPIKDALMFNYETAKSRRNEGETFFKAENPPFGATFTYYIKDSYKTKKQLRKESEKETTTKGGTAPYPSLAELSQEDKEEAPYLIFTIKSKDGKVVRQLKESVKTGINRITWDLRYPLLNPLNENSDPNKQSGFHVFPGEYTVSLSKCLDGKVTEIVPPTSFICKPLNNTLMPAPDRKALVDFQQGLIKLYGTLNATNAYLNELENKLNKIQKTVFNTPNASSDLFDLVRQIEYKLVPLKIKLHGDESISKRAANQTPSINERLGYVVEMMWYSSSKVSKTNLDAYQLCHEELKSVINSIKELENKDIKALDAKLDELGAPWTPGRLLEIK